MTDRQFEDWPDGVRNAYLCMSDPSFHRCPSCRTPLESGAIQTRVRVTHHPETMEIEFRPVTASTRYMKFNHMKWNDQ